MAVSPYVEVLSARERARITWTDLKQATSRIADYSREHAESLSETPTVIDLQKLNATSVSIAREWSELNLERHPDRIDPAMLLVFRLEDTAAQQMRRTPNGS